MIDEETFGQLLDMDEDDEEREFTKEMVNSYFQQVDETFIKMDESLSVGFVAFVLSLIFILRSAARDLTRLSDLGHFLKGSSAALGLSRVQVLCQKIQNCGGCRDEGLEENLKPSDAMVILKVLLKTVRVEYPLAKAWLEDFLNLPPS